MRELDPAGSAVADVCTGSGALAVAAALAGARRVLAVDVSRRAMLATRLNAALNRCAVEARRGELLNALGEERFDLILSNPPYVPAATDALPRHRSTTPLDGGRDGRALIDPICVGAASHLTPGGSVLLVHSSVCGVEETCALLRASGLESSVLHRVSGSLGPVMQARAPMLRERGLLDPGEKEDLAVVCGRALL